MSYSGELPDNVYLDNYTNNGQTDVGEYEVEARFVYKIGHTILASYVKTATLKITPKVYDVSAQLTLNKNLTYNGFYQEALLEDVPEWIDVVYENNLRREIGTQDFKATATNKGNSNYILINGEIEDTLKIEPYVYTNFKDTDTDPVIAVATEDKIELTIKNLGTSGTAQVVYFRSYEYFVIDEYAGVSTYQSNGTPIEGAIYNCGTTQTITFDRYIPYGEGSIDLVYCKFAVRVGDESNYELLHNEVYCKDIYSKCDYSYGLKTTIKGIDYPPRTPTEGVDDAVALNANFFTYNMLLKDTVWPNEYVDLETGEIHDFRPYINYDDATPFVVNGVTYYIKESYFTRFLDHAYAAAKANNVKMIPIFYNWNEDRQDQNPYFATYPDARDTGSMTQFALNTSNPMGEGYLIACIEYMMRRYSDDGLHVLKDVVIGNELELCQRWYPIQTYRGKEIYSPRKFAAEYTRTLRLANNAIKKYIPDGTAYAPFSRYMSPSTISKDSVYTIKSLVEAINENSKREGDFDWGLSVHPYNHSYPNDIVNGSMRLGEFNSTIDAKAFTYSNIEILDKFLKNPELYYSGHTLRKVIMCESGIACNTTLESNKLKSMASIAFSYYRSALLDSIYAFCLSDDGKFKMFDEAREVWKYIDSEDTFDVAGDLYQYLYIYDRVNKVNVSAEERGVTSWAEFLDIWDDPDIDWEALWDERKIITSGVI